MTASWDTAIARAWPKDGQKCNKNLAYGIPFASRRSGLTAGRNLLDVGAMFRRLTLALTLLLAACASDTGAPGVEPRPLPAPLRPGSHQHGRLTGLSVGELGDLLGSPSLQVREGPGLKLQYRGGGCVLDAYLYAPTDGRGVERVTHADARLPSGADTDVAGCEAAIEASR